MVKTAKNTTKKGTPICKKQDYILKIIRERNITTVTVNGLNLDPNKTRKILQAIHGIPRREWLTHQRRVFIANNDHLKDKELAERFGVCIGTILNDKKVISTKGIASEAPPRESIKMGQYLAH